MKTVTKLGLGLLVVGAAILATSSGAFDSMAADRGIGVETAHDADAYVGLDYPNADQNRVIRLQSSEADSGGCFLIFCSDYEYDDVEVTVITDQTASTELIIEDLRVERDGDGITNEIRKETAGDSLRVVTGDFECQNWRGQQAGSTTLTISLEVSDGSFSTTLDREVTVKCVSD
ncbi:hypothetical protein [Natrinema limicola]|uniref:Uncharacterized protein n=1 Tax=Natrinema limicola JCM 13563 TaxID=1230457 RepID=M0CKX5_9EURY|nr:hypothetical protein [Natrinema limicola]ELZ22997.1 hypothetical protein C476_05457 [Natrinema limicola JCM 13563]